MVQDMAYTNDFSLGLFYKLEVLSQTSMPFVLPIPA